jgi:hypothetical protein
VAACAVAMVLTMDRPRPRRFRSAYHDGIAETSVAAPLWAAVIALANQYAERDLGFVNPALYPALWLQHRTIAACEATLPAELVSV